MAENPQEPKTVTLKKVYKVLYLGGPWDGRMGEVDGLPLRVTTSKPYAIVDYVPVYQYEQAVVPTVLMGLEHSTIADAMGLLIKGYTPGRR